MSELFSALNVSGAGLSVNRRKMNVTAENIANVETTRTSGGGPYRKKQVVIRGDSRETDFGTVLMKHTLELNRTNLEHMQSPRQYSTTSEELVLPEAREAIDPRSKVKMVYDPSHPDANPDGWVEMPDINMIVEMVNMMTASRSYEANVTALESTKNIYSAALEI